MDSRTRAREWGERWMCVEHKATCSRVRGSMPLPAWVNVETGCCDECGRRVSLPRETLDSLTTAFASVRRETLEECLRILEDPDLETYRDAIDRIRALATPTKPGDETK